MANRLYRPKHPWRDQKGTRDDPILVSFFPPSSPSNMFNLYNIENYRLLHYFGKLLTTFSDKITVKFEFFLPSSNFLVPPFYPPKNIKVGPIIRIILVPPLSSVNLRRERRGSEDGGGLSPLWVRNPSPWSSQMKWHFLQGSMESRHGGLSPSQPPPPVGAPSFWKGWLRPS